MKKNIFYTLLFFVICFSFSSCDSLGIKSDAVGEAATTGVAGSYARMITVGDFLYFVDQSQIQTFSLTDPSLPHKINTQTIGSQIESIFNYEDKLFIGSGEGLFIYTIGQDGIPQQTASVGYEFPILPCDPVVANDTYAYVTLHDGDSQGPCAGMNNVNQLKIFDVTDIYNPEEIAVYPMFRPKGVGIDGNILFVCDDLEGLKIFDVSNPLEIQMLHQFSHFQAFDVIPLGGLLLCVGTDNIYQFDYSNINDIQEISRIPIQS